MRILIAEDDFIARNLLLRILHPFGACEAACDGKEALRAFRAAFAAGEPYGLVVLDYQMPGMDGGEVLLSMRAFEAEAGVKGKEACKICMATHVSEKGKILESFAKGCDGYILKPYDRDKVVGDLRLFHILAA